MVIIKPYVLVAVIFYLSVSVLLSVKIQAGNSYYTELFTLDYTKLTQELAELKELELLIERELESTSYLFDVLANGSKEDKLAIIDSAYFHLGQEDAKLFYGNSNVFISGIIASGFIPTISAIYGCGSQNYEAAIFCAAVLNLFPVICYSFYVKDLPVNTIKDSVVTREFNDHPDYYKGYEYKAKKIRVRIARIGSWVGYFVGVTGFILLVASDSPILW
ncbi:MAG: hypothetical protein JKY15_01255 [Deltaproteobacteria bacterium]|nr:hypothetical protein [Deltaproteobacteria bacterium]